MTKRVHPHDFDSIKKSKHSLNDTTNTLDFSSLYNLQHIEQLRNMYKELQTQYKHDTSQLLKELIETRKQVNKLKNHIQQHSIT